MTSKALFCSAIYFAEACGKSVTLGTVNGEWNQQRPRAASPLVRALSFVYWPSVSIACRPRIMADDVVTDLEIAVLCDLLDGPGVNLRAHKRSILNSLVSKGLVGAGKR